MENPTRPIVTMTDETKARALMIVRNRTRRGNTDIAVLVEGPEDGEFTVMDLRDAVESDFAYRWEV